MAVWQLWQCCEHSKGSHLWIFFKLVFLNTTMYTGKVTHADALVADAAAGCSWRHVQDICCTLSLHMHCELRSFFTGSVNRVLVSAGAGGSSSCEHRLACYVDIVLSCCASRVLGHKLTARLDHHCLLLKQMVFSMLHACRGFLT